ncbi:hypothetical protein BKA70DRAFT_1377959 [Coprinopsis sp. MPI-PUGE-AT-0042]|nr:hypothetical protein BKA70DRAFT_1377959 [Coprinopsis sp. MPI-PUGE-AT-0042]
MTFSTPGPRCIKLGNASSSNSSRSRGRGRGNRGGLGKYLRARGRGHRGGGRPAVFKERLLLEGEGPDDGGEDEESEAEGIAKFSRRQLGTNADRYAEKEPELGSDGEPIVEPEIDLSEFMERQLISDEPSPALALDSKSYDDDEVDNSLAHISSKSIKSPVDRKGKVQQVDWDRELDEMTKEKAAAEAQWGAFAILGVDPKHRFKAKSEKLKAKPIFKSTRERQAEKYEQAPELPVADTNAQPKKDPKDEIESLLDDLYRNVKNKSLSSRSIHHRPQHRLLVLVGCFKPLRHE